MAGSPDQLVSAALIERLVSEYVWYDKNERKEERKYVQLPVKVCLYDQGRVVEFGVTRNISTQGIGVIIQRSIKPGSHIFIQLATLSGEFVDVPTKVIHCTAFGPFFHIGGYFMDRLN